MPKKIKNTNLPTTVSKPKSKSMDTVNRNTMTGTVIWFSNVKGYGLILLDDNATEVFVDKSSILDSDKSLSVGQRVKLSLKEATADSLKMEEEAHAAFTNEMIRLDTKLYNDIIIIKSEQEGKTSFRNIQLTPDYLLNNVSPFLLAIADLQRIFDEITGNKSNIVIKTISQNSPIKISLDGAAKAIQVVTDTVVPWRRKHAETMAQLDEKEKLIAIKHKTAEISERRARVLKERAEADKLAAEAATQHAQAEKIKIENEKLRFDLQKDKIQMALDLINKANPHMTETEKINYVMKLLAPIDVLVESDIQITSSRQSDKCEKVDEI